VWSLGLVVKTSEQLSFLPLAGREVSTTKGAVAALFGWEGNRRSGIALARRHRLCGISIYRLNGLRKGKELPTDTPLRTVAPFTFTFYIISNKLTRHRARTSMYSLTFLRSLFVARTPPVEARSPDCRSNVENAPVSGGPAAPASRMRRAVLGAHPVARRSPAGGARRPRPAGRVTTMHFASSTTHAKCNNNGLKTEPCGTEHVTGTVAEVHPPYAYMTQYDLPVR